MVCSEVIETELVEGCSRRRSLGQFTAVEAIAAPAAAVRTKSRRVVWADEVEFSGIGNS
jgi:hypothetical protein